MCMYSANAICETCMIVRLLFTVLALCCFDTTTVYQLIMGGSKEQVTVTGHPKASPNLTLKLTLTLVLALGLG